MPGEVVPPGMGNPEVLLPEFSTPQIPEKLYPDLKSMMDASGIYHFEYPVLYKFANAPSLTSLAGFHISFQDMFNPEVPINISLTQGLSTMRTRLAIAHEWYVHVLPIDAARQAGSYQNLIETHPELVYELGRLNNMNRGHHNYIANIIDRYEQFLRNAFPGYNEDFYLYGKWLGLMDTDAYRDLPKTEKALIEDYLNNLK